MIKKIPCVLTNGTMLAISKHGTSRLLGINAPFMVLSCTLSSNNLNWIPRGLKMSRSLVVNLVLLIDMS